MHLLKAALNRVIVLVAHHSYLSQSVMQFIRVIGDQEMPTNWVNNGKFTVFLSSNFRQAEVVFIVTSSFRMVECVF